MTPAQLAGARGRSAEPMSTDKRVDSYTRQNGHRRALTPRQERRTAKKFRRLAKAGVR